MNRQIVKLIKPLAPESAARKRARIARERFLRTVFYQGANPLTSLDTARPTYLPDVGDDHTLRGFMALLRMSVRIVIRDTLHV
jgi:hypothetical protein